MSLTILQVRLYFSYNLILFIPILFSSCTKKPDGIVLVWKDNQAVGILISGNQIIKDQFVVRVKDDQTKTSVRGNLKMGDGGIIFEPLIPLTPGITYQIVVNGLSAGEVQVHVPAGAASPEVVSIYPTSDSLPENLLKFYVQFSKPMRESKSARYLNLVDQNGDTLSGSFLDIQPELWNADRTMLTVWLDPGRIKRGLHPNLLQGPPLRKGKKYRLVVSEQWKSIDGLSLAKPASKNFTATGRDSVSPDPTKWTLNTPKPGTVEPLRINFHEALDFSLLTSTLHIEDQKGEILKGKWKIGTKETTGNFVPAFNWRAGNYKCRIETRLEDLAGNNLGRRFEEDATMPPKPPPESSVSIPFTITLTQ